MPHRDPGALVHPGAPIALPPAACGIIGLPCRLASVAGPPQLRCRHCEIKSRADIRLRIHPNPSTQRVDDFSRQGKA